MFEDFTQADLNDFIEICHFSLQHGVKEGVITTEDLCNLVVLAQVGFEALEEFK